MTATASVQAPAGWQCSKQYNGSPRSATFTCTAASLAAGASADFAVRVNTRPTPAGRVIVVQGSASSPTPDANPRSEEHTSELQSLMRISYAVFCLKKKKQHTHQINICAQY